VIAALPMYEFPWTSPSLDAIWTDIARRLRAAGVEAPTSLTRSPDLAAQWRDESLLFGQTCGYPYRHGLQDVVEILATPRFVFDGCEGASHCSFLVARHDDPRHELAEFRGARAAINSHDSNTGMNLFRAAFAPVARGAPFFAATAVTGSHVASLAAVATGVADIAAIDCVTFGLVARHDPAAVESVRSVGRTPASPCLPFIASLALPPETRELARDALFQALASPLLAEAWMTLGITGAEILPPEAYQRIDELEAEAARLGYPQLD
jgi:ABC-type phosphate/phosphonate transport system substrate-binding protein